MRGHTQLFTERWRSKGRFAQPACIGTEPRLPSPAVFKLNSKVTFSSQSPLRQTAQKLGSSLQDLVEGTDRSQAVVTRTVHRPWMFISGVGMICTAMLMRRPTFSSLGLGHGQLSFRAAEHSAYLHESSVNGLCLLWGGVSHSGAVLFMAFIV